METGAIVSPYKKNKKCRIIIVLFTTFRRRTQVLGAKRKMKDGVASKVQLTKRRHNFLTVTNKLVKDNNDAVLLQRYSRLKNKRLHERRDDSFF